MGGGEAGPGGHAVTSQQPMDNMRNVKLSLRECLSGIIFTDFILFFSSPVRKVLHSSPFYKRGN